MEFEWDPDKNLENIRKHGLAFSDANRVFNSPMLEALDDGEDYGEGRWIGIGLLDARIVVLVFTEPRPETVRIISLRKALSHERQRFEKYLQDELGKG